MLFYLLFGTVQASPEWSCQHPWLPMLLNDSPTCHRVLHRDNRDILSYSDAEQLCSEHQATLSVISSKEAAEFALDVVTRGWRIPYRNSPQNLFWIASINDSSNISIDIGDRYFKTGECLAFSSERNYQHLQRLPCNLEKSFSPPRHVFCQSESAKKIEMSHSCDAGWSFYEKSNSCHKLLKIGVSSASGAEALCRAEGAQLSNFETAEEKTFAHDLITSGYSMSCTEERICKMFPIWTRDWPRNAAWIGLNGFVWSNGAILEDHLMFGDGEPHGQLGAENCSLIVPLETDKGGRAGAIRDVSCDPWLHDHWIEYVVSHVLCKKQAERRDKPTINKPPTIPKDLICSEPANVYKDGQKCHKLLQIGVTTVEGARSVCRMNGGRLSTLRSSGEIQFVMDLIQRGFNIGSHTKYFDSVWVDLIKDNSTGKWKWHGNEELEDDQSVAENKEDRSCSCASLMPKANMKVLFGAVPCDVEYFIDDKAQPPSHILCEQDYDETIARNFSPSPCSKDWYFYEQDSSCIKFFSEEATQPKAKLGCASHGAKLVSIDTAEKRNFANEISLKGWRPHLLRDENLVLAWIGLEWKNRTWLWENGKPFDRQLWNIGSNFFFRSPSAENCSAFHPHRIMDNLPWADYGTLVKKQCEINGGRLQTLQNYICEKDAGNTKKSTEDRGLWIILIACIIVSCIAVAAFFKFGFTRRKRLHRNSLIEMNELPLMSRNFMEYDVCSMEFDANYYIPAGNITEATQIGHGYFGVVKMAKLKHPADDQKLLEVAVKSVKDARDAMQCDSLNTEIKLMCKLGTHPNVVKVIGAVFSDSTCHDNRLVLELCNGGNLRDFLHLSYSGDYEMPKNDKRTIRTKVDELASFSLQIANGMAYLSSLPCLHRDLSAKNILLTENKICKITDFGLSKFNFYYRVQSQAALPFRWMSPETHRNQQFTKQSDVWSFGIVLFEIFSYGASPYGHIHNPDEIIVAIMNGVTNEIPPNCPVEIADLTEQCWNLEPPMRPSFDDCYAVLREFQEKNYPDQWNKLAKLLSTERKLQNSYKEWLPGNEDVNRVASFSED